MHPIAAGQGHFPLDSVPFSEESGGRCWPGAKPESAGRTATRPADRAPLFHSTGRDDGRLQSLEPEICQPTTDHAGGRALGPHRRVQCGAVCSVNATLRADATPRPTQRTRRRRARWSLASVWLLQAGTARVSAAPHRRPADLLFSAACVSVIHRLYR